MDSSVQLVDEQAFKAYASRVAQGIALKQQQLTAFGGDDWFDRIRAYEEGCEFDRKGSVAVIKIKGFLAYGYDFWMWLFDGSSYCGLINKVRAAADDTSITKIVLDVNSPGGSTIGCIEASDAIFAARAKKEVVSVINPEAASAGYWLATQAKKVFAMRSGFVGSVGAEIDYRSFAAMFKEAGIDMAIIRSEVSPDKNLGHAAEPISDRAKEYFQGLCDYAAADFIAHVARGRGIDESAVLKNFGKGRMLFGRQALDAGMIDAIGTLADVLAEPTTTAGKTTAVRRPAAVGAASADRRLFD
jgi:signal peptide peptidase SppA